MGSTPGHRYTPTMGYSRYCPYLGGMRLDPVVAVLILATWLANFSGTEPTLRAY
jgi:hypothetical protein